MLQCKICKAYKLHTQPEGKSKEATNSGEELLTDKGDQILD